MTLTNLRRQKDGLVRTRKESDQDRGTYSLEMVEEGPLSHRKKVTKQARGTHQLEKAEGETGQDTERKGTGGGTPTSWRRRR